MRRSVIILVAVLLVLGMTSGIAAADPTPPQPNGHNCEAVNGIVYLPVYLGWNGYSHLAQDALAAGEIPADRIGRQWAGNTDYHALKNANCGNNTGTDHTPTP